MPPRTTSSSRLEARMQMFAGSRVALPVRQQLLDCLLEETGGATGGQRITLFIAPTGYGKTRTVRTWLGDSDDVDSIRWVTCAPDSAQGLWRSIHAELSQVVTSAADNPDDFYASSLLLARRLKSTTTLVIDDYHHATSPENDLDLAEFAGASPFLELIVIGRRVSVLDSTLVTAKRRVRVCDTGSLALTFEECREIALSLGIASSPALEAALTLTEGWPLAVRAALNIGADEIYLPSVIGGDTANNTEFGVFDPLANLHSFAVSYFQLLSEPVRRVLLTAATIDAVNLQQVQEVIEGELAVALSAVKELIELGLIREIATPNGTEYRCHAVMREPLRKLDPQLSRPDERQQVLRRRAGIIEPTAPFAAFAMYCEAEDYEAAEMLLASFFSTFTDEGEVCGAILRSIPESAQRDHPTFTAALLFLETPKPSVSSTTLSYLTNLWQHSLHERLSGESDPLDPMHLPLLCQAMVAARITGRVDASVEIMRKIKDRLVSDVPAGKPSPYPYPYPYQQSSVADPPFSGSLPTYYREISSTALKAGDFVRARRSLMELRKHSEHRIAAPWHGFGHASTRTVTERQAGERWLLAALSELAFTELSDGNMRSCAELLDEYDARIAESGESAPSISWVGAEISRAHLAYERLDTALLEEAVAKLTPFKDRLERWPLLLMAEAASLRIERGAEWALNHVRAELARGDMQVGAPSKWRDYFISFQAMLCTTIGDLAQAGALLDDCAPEATLTRIERARLALFSGDDVGALIISQGIGDPETTIRQRADRCLIAAVASWNLGRRDDAFAELSHAAILLASDELPSMLQSVPYDTLREVTFAALAAEACDLTAMVEQVPAPARCVRYERLTEMELNTLAAIAEHRNTNKAAASLHVTPSTVKKHLVSAYRKLRVNERDEAILQASRMGLLRQTP